MSFFSNTQNVICHIPRINKKKKCVKILLMQINDKGIIEIIIEIFFTVYLQKMEKKRKKKKGYFVIR